MARAFGRLAPLWLLPWLCSAALAADEGRATITYVTGVSVYVDAGGADGLRVGDAIEVLREGAVVATLRVSEVSAHRAVCPLEGLAAELRVGDLVRFARSADVPEAATGTAVAPAGASGSSTKHRGAGLRGRVGLRYLGVRDRSGFGQDLAQPGLDLRLDGADVGGSAFDVALDVRARRTYKTSTAGVDSDYGDERVYRLLGAWHEGPWRVTLGRQFSPALSNVSLFDGVLGELRKPRWAVGVLAGTQPDADYGFSGDVREYGAYFETGNAPAAPRRWTLTTGLIGSYQEGEINREFLYLQGRYSARRVAAYLAGEVDLNRDWRKDAEGDSVTMTSAYGWLRWRATEALQLNLGYDDRRNPRLYHDLVTPVTEFDDAYRRGGWVGAEWRPRGRWLVGLEARSSSGGTAGDADAYTIDLGALGLTSVALDLRLRTTRYENPFLEGWLYVLQAGAAVGPRVRLGGHVGTRDETDLRAFEASRSLQWYGLDLDLVLGRRWYGTLAVESYSGEEEDNDQVYSVVGYRF